MKKELKDYLHLYLGSNLMCQRMGEEGEFLMTGISWDDTQRVWWVYFENQENSYSILEDVFPVLRPLTGMTNNERVKIINTIDFMDTSYEYIRRLLSKHFDLFGLIESGLAIDATTLQPTTIK